MKRLVSSVGSIGTIFNVGFRQGFVTALAGWTSVPMFSSVDKWCLQGQLKGFQQKLTSSFRQRYQ